MNIFSSVRIWCVVLLALGGCAGVNGNSLEYIGNSNELGGAATPSGFSVSPQDAMAIVNSHHGPKKTVDDFYYDSEHYYVVDGFNGSRATTALRNGTMINGRTGEIYNRQTKSWEPDPRFEKQP